MKHALIVLCTLFAFIPRLVTGNEILCWQVDETATVNGIGIMEFLTGYPDDDDNWPAARIQVTDSILGSPAILNIWGEDENGNPELWDGYWGVWLGDVGGGYWGTGAYVQSPLEIDGLELTSNALLTMQIGHNTWNDEIGDYAWTTLAEAAPITRAWLEIQDYTYTAGSLAPPTQTSWTPTEFTTNIPEPGTGILLAMGIVVILLRRRNS